MTHSPKTKSDKSSPRRSLFFILWLFCILGSWAVIPYSLQLGLSKSISFVNLFLLMTIESALLFGIVCWLSYFLVPKTDLSPFIYEKPLKRIIIPGVIAGTCVGLAIFLLDHTFFKHSPLSAINPAYWAGFLASFYGAINEEVLLRLFFFTLVYFLFQRILRFEKRNRIYFLWITNLIVALLFGIGHLPMAFKIGNVSGFEVFRILLLNGIGGIVFGWLYWSRGLWAAMTAHFVADLIIHVFLI